VKDIVRLSVSLLGDVSADGDIESDVAKLASDLIRIPSVTGKEGEVSEQIARVMKTLGMSVEFDEPQQGRKNVIGRLEGTGKGPILVFNGHVDVVPPGDISKWNKDPFGGLVYDGRIYGRGAADMKGGLASILTAVSRFVNSSSKMKGELVMEAVVDEEAGGRAGTGRLTTEKPVRGDFVIIPEPTNLELAIAHKGDLGLEIEVEGRSAHAATPELGINAVHKSIQLATKILAIPERFKWSDRTHALLGPPSIAISVIDGGIQRNIIPDRCRMVVDRRTVPSFENLEVARREFSTIMSEARAEDSQLKVSMKELLAVEGTETKQGEEVVQLVSKVCSDVMGAPPKIIGLKGFCDCHYFSENLGIPAVAFGPGRLEQAHIIDEYVEIEQLVAATRIFHRLMEDLLS